MGEELCRYDTINHIWPDGFEWKCFESMLSGEEHIYAKNENEAAEFVSGKETYNLLFSRDHILANREGKDTLTRVQKLKTVFTFLDSYEYSDREKIVDTLVDYLNYIYKAKNRKELLVKTFEIRALIESYKESFNDDDNASDADDIQYIIRDNISDVHRVLEYTEDVPVKIIWDGSDEHCNKLNGSLIKYIRFINRWYGDCWFSASEDFIVGMLLDVDFSILYILTDDIFCGFEKKIISLLGEFMEKPVFQLKSADSICDDDIPF